MKFIHTGDLHIGKVLNGYNLLEDQKFILGQIIEISITEKVDAVLLSGDLYDRSVPSTEATLVLDYFITKLIQNKIKVFAINGNHDSPERLSFANSIMAKQGFYIDSSYHEKIKSIRVHDEYGEVNVHFLPFIRPALDNDSVKAMLVNSPIDTSQRNIILAHHFVTDAGSLPGEFEGEEVICVGDSDYIDVSCFSMFDYTALGHIHRAMKIGEGNVYYSGSPLKYSFKESSHKKGMYLVELGEKGNVSVDKLLLSPKHDLRIIKGNIDELLIKTNQLENKSDYICAVLTNQEQVMEPFERLKSIYPNILQILFEKNIKSMEFHEEIENVEMLMKPLSIEINAWGPYKNKQVIDFAKFGDKGVFLITGPSGSGKTSIVDTITYALYGKVSRDVDLTILDSETNICFRFLHYGNVIEVYRNAKDEALVKRNGIEIGCGSLQVNEIINEILGINFEKFKSIALLDYWSIRSLLITNPKEWLDNSKNCAYVKDLLSISNRYLLIMSEGRFEIIKGSEELEVMDYYMGRTRRLKTLSGGESFKAALALALGLSDTLLNNTSVVSLFPLFMDEGFGELDNESLDQAIDVLLSIANSNRLIGIISHVEELKERIEHQIIIEKTSLGSRIRQ